MTGDYVYVLFLLLIVFPTFSSLILFSSLLRPSLPLSLPPSLPLSLTPSLSPSPSPFLPPSLPSNPNDYALKVAGQESYVYGHYELIQFTHVLHCLSKKQDIELVLVKKLSSEGDRCRDIPDVSVCVCVCVCVRGEG